MNPEVANEPGRGEGKQQRCTAPHPVKSFLWSLPAFAVVIGAILIWRLL